MKSCSQHRSCRLAYSCLPVPRPAQPRGIGQQAASAATGAAGWSAASAGGAASSSQDCCSATASMLLEPRYMPDGTTQCFLSATGRDDLSSLSCFFGCLITDIRCCRHTLQLHLRAAAPPPLPQQQQQQQQQPEACPHNLHSCSMHDRQQPERQQHTQQLQRSGCAKQHRQQQQQSPTGCQPGSSSEGEGYSCYAIQQQQQQQLSVLQHDSSSYCQKEQLQPHTSPCAQQQQLANGGLDAEAAALRKMLRLRQLHSSWRTVVQQQQQQHGVRLNNTRMMTWNMVIWMLRSQQPCKQRSSSSHKQHIKCCRSHTHQHPNPHCLHPSSSSKQSLEHRR
ncbi:hypothetical protein COO60DRAFT_797923 [Scenedesmus sp. NREL 46B-D3]|nr:hypothetical protein COO60DRAFT_797923 [Scenedesmus sp. NREL 46B-D3]